MQLLADAVCASIVAGMLAIGAVGCGGGDSSTASNSTSAGGSSTASDGSTSGDSSTVAAPGAGCKRVKPQKAEPTGYNAPAQVVKKGEKLTAVVKTSCGTFDIALNTRWSPTAVNSFVFLAEKGFYDGLGFEQAAYGTYVEGGKPDGADGPGYSVEGEIPESFIYRHGVVAMSQSIKSPPGHSGSRFFVVVASPWLDFSRLYAPFGRVSKGIDVLESISELGPPDPYTGTSNLGTIGEIGKLRRPVLIEKITIDRA